MQRLGEKSSASVGDQTLLIQSVVRHYTDWATQLKKDNKTTYNNYQGISLLLTTNINLTYILLSRLAPYIHEIIKMKVIELLPY
jgi:hypothetical protein